VFAEREVQRERVRYSQREGVREKARETKVRVGGGSGGSG